MIPKEVETNTDGSSFVAAPKQIQMGHESDSPDSYYMDDQDEQNRRGSLKRHGSGTLKRNNSLKKMGAKLVRRVSGKRVKHHSSSSKTDALVDGDMNPQQQDGTTTVTVTMSYDDDEELKKEDPTNEVVSDVKEKGESPVVEKEKCLPNNKAVEANEESKWSEQVLQMSDCMDWIPSEKVDEFDISDSDREDEDEDKTKSETNLDALIINKQEKLNKDETLVPTVKGITAKQQEGTVDKDEGCNDVVLHVRTATEDELLNSSSNTLLLTTTDVVNEVIPEDDILIVDDDEEEEEKEEEKQEERVEEEDDEEEKQEEKVEEEEEEEEEKELEEEKVKDEITKEDVRNEVREEEEEGTLCKKHHCTQQQQSAISASSWSSRATIASVVVAFGAAWCFNQHGMMKMSMFGGGNSFRTSS